MHFHELFSEGIECIRKYRFEAAHYEYDSRYHEEYNRIIYDHNTRVHGHNYEVYVLLKGQERPETGMVIELGSIDEVVNFSIVDRFDHNLINDEFPNEVITHEYFAQQCSNILCHDFAINNIPDFYYGVVVVENSEEFYTKVIQKESPMVYRTHITSFSAAHKLTSPFLTEQENESVYGKCQNLHGHNYKLSVTLCGEPSEVTGLLINDSDFNDIIHNIINKFTYEELHKMPLFSDIIPTTENFIKFLWSEFETDLNFWNKCQLSNTQHLFSQNLKLDCLVLQETDRNIFVYRGE